MNARAVVIGAGLILAVSAFSGGAQCPPPGRGGPGGDSFGRTLIERAEQFGAKPEQIEMLTEFLFDQRAKMIDLRASVEKAELALDRLLERTPADREAVNGAIDELNAARGALFKLELLGRLEVQRIVGKKLSDRLHPPAPLRGTAPFGFAGRRECGSSMKQGRGEDVDREP